MEVLTYASPLPPHRTSPDSFVDRNPNLCYLAVAGRSCVMIDVCSDLPAVRKALEERRLQLDAILITHYHGDHTFALKEWLQVFPELTVGIHQASLPSLKAAGLGEKQLLPLRDNKVVTVGGEVLTVIAAPGHTRDSLCFWDERGTNLFSGDVIFGGAIGCSDYRRGGNRNIYYETILKLLHSLPPATRLYPGHRSEHYQTLPPYPLAREKTKNPYIANALAGKRASFNRALKFFSIEFEYMDVVMLDASALEAISALEREIWIPELQASAETIRERLDNGHRLLTIKEDEGFTGMVGWCYSPFRLQDGPDSFPRNFREFSNCQSCCPKTAHAAFIYNVGVKPDLRRRGIGSLLLQEAFEKIRKDGISHVFLDSRMASYNGSAGHAQENVLKNDAFHAGVNNYFKTGKLPEEPLLKSDHTVSFYMKNGFSPWIIRRDFIPDVPSGNMRVICYLNIDEDRRPL